MRNVRRAESNPHGRSPRATAGFALLMTVMVLAFLVLLLVAMATLGRIGEGMAGGVQRRGLARQNALLALDVALGRLQLMTGPDRRVTASADSFGAANPHYTGVWDATADGRTPLTWLVSGNEFGDPLAVTPADEKPGKVELVGHQTTGRAADVTAPLQAIRTVGFPGERGDAVIGHYAWWVGDQGVKAPVATPERTPDIDYPPYETPEKRRRLRQQSGAGAAATEFEAADSENQPLIRNLTAFNQLAFLRRADASAVGRAALQRNYHAWSPGNFSVLASTRPGGLRQDLSLRPDLLGPAFAAWVDYAASTEDPANPGVPRPSPAYGADPLRRRHRMTAPVSWGGITHGISPVLTYFLLTFNIRTQAGSRAVKPVEVRARWMFTLWNPYTSALVPENLRLEIAGLSADVRVVDDTLGLEPAVVSLPATFGSPLRINLPWDYASAPDADRQSWLPGRVYTWTALENLSGTTPINGYASRFYSRNLSADAGQGVQHATAGPMLDGDDVCHLVVAGKQTLVARLFSVRAGGDVLLASFASPEFAGFSTTPRKLNSGTYQFSYLFRLAESADTPAAPETWLAAAGGDVRQPELGAGSFVTGPNGNRPELYENYTAISAPDRLCDRAANAFSYNEDAPLFELNRAPLLSLGQLQHLQLAGARPFAIGNSWGFACQANGIPANALFDRFYFSGLASGVAPPSAKPLPDTSLQLLRSKSDGLFPAPRDLTDPSLAGWTARCALQGGTFNLNSVDRNAWLAVLRRGRLTGPDPFTGLDASAATGTAGDASILTLPAAAAQFFRFPQSVQESWKADAPRGNSTYAASTTVPPLAPNNPSSANTHLFRQGLRALDAAQAGALADAVVARMREKHAASGPFRCIEEFLNPSALFSADDGHALSLIERAIADAGLNSAIGEFSSQWLSQADLMTALAPVLTARSDTFVIRTYGDAFNPVTGVVEGRAWAEALVQRQPEYFDPAEPEETAPAALNPLNQRYGRRFKIVQFRWLTLADI